MQNCIGLTWCSLGVIVSDAAAVASAAASASTGVLIVSSMTCRHPSQAQVVHYNGVGRRWATAGRAVRG